MPLHNHVSTNRKNYPIKKKEKSVEI